ncbi:MULTISPECIES: winged helix-turn-helix transcriptional regulator [Paenibacillus]|uniref:winged helix-turn-helix transcriptional regulator n=1 Tax=Paenibacillus TaxID=44249 RepID=UPI0013D34B52|nr:helix-turn-helix domain-containing protein [Paenibacillus sp. ALJ109b]NEU59981.1 helix-turn-helix transcriptional regulator [Paenibacillus sp. ALJ109b]
MRVCNEGFDQNFMDENKDMYAIAFTQNILSGRWKYFILWYLKTETRRYSDIKKFLGDLSQGSLTKQLKELENSGIIKRDVYPEIPPRVEYSLTDKGTKLLPILEKMEDFGRQFGE